MLSCMVRARELWTETNTEWNVKYISEETLSFGFRRAMALDKQKSNFNDALCDSRLMRSLVYVCFLSFSTSM